MLWFLFYLFLAYIAYNLVFKFIIPIYRTTRQVKRGFREMQERMQQQAGQPGAHHQQQARPSAKEVSGDYIDFEEVK